MPTRALVGIDLITIITIPYVAERYSFLVVTYELEFESRLRVVQQTVFAQ